MANYLTGARTVEKVSLEGVSMLIQDMGLVPDTLDIALDSARSVRRGMSRTFTMMSRASGLMTTTHAVNAGNRRESITRTKGRSDKID